MQMRQLFVRAAVGMTGALAMGACSASTKTPSVSNTTAAVSTPATTGAVGATSNPPTSGPTTTVASANFDSCSVVTQAEAASAIGQSVTPGVPGNATVEGGKACVFYGPLAPPVTTPDAAQPDTVRVVLVKGADALQWYNDYKTKVPAQSVSGYGDQAYFDGRASLSILKGDAYLRIAVAPPGAPPSLTDEEHLAAAILPGV